MFATRTVRKVADPSGRAEVKPGRAVELDWAGVIADVEDIAVAVVREERGGRIVVDGRAGARRRALLRDD